MAMARPSKRDIKAALDKLKESAKPAEPPQHQAPKLSDKKGGNRIRKKGAT